jgi:hypothetical protein
MVLTNMTDYLLQVWDRGLVIDFVIGLTVAEAGFLLGLYYLVGRGLAPGQYLLNLVSGLFLMLALRAAQSAGAWYLPMMCLLVAGLCHLADLIWRAKRTVAPESPHQRAQV